MTERQPLATTGDLAALLEADLEGPGDLPLFGVAGLDDATSGDLSFIRDARYANRWANSKAVAAVVTRGIEVEGHTPDSRALLFVEDADRAMIAMLEAAQARAPRHTPEPGVHPGAHVSAGVQVPASASIGAGAVVGTGATIGEHVVIGPGASIAPGVTIGPHTVLHARVALMEGTRIGAHCTVFPGAVVGADGFGFLPGPKGPIKVPHLGGVTIGDHVEVGANSTIDRGKFDDTTIGDGSKIDNQVQIAHACKLGKGVIICGCCAVGGSVTIGDGALLAGHVCVRDNVNIAAGAVVGGNSAIDGDVESGEPWFGYPARPISVASRNYAALIKLGELWSGLRELRKRVRAIENKA